MRVTRFFAALMLVAVAAGPAQAQFTTGGRDDTRPPLPTWGQHVGASALGAVLLGGLGLAVGEIDVSTLNDWGNSGLQQRKHEPKTIQGLAVLGTLGGSALGASLVGRNLGDASPYVFSALGTAIGGLMGYGTGALLTGSKGVEGAGFFVGSVLGAATGAYLARQRVVLRSGMRVSFAPMWGGAGNSGAQLRVTF